MDTPSTALKPQFFLHTSLSLSATVILLYDHIITFDNECRRIWTRPWCKASAIFLLTRYVAFFVIPVMLYTDFPEMSAPTTCQHFKLYRQIAIGIMQLIVAANQFLRVYALYGRDRRVAAAVALVAGTVGAISVWSITVRETSDAEANCHLILSGETANRMAIVWVAYFAYDLLIFALMLTKAARDRAQLAQAERGSLITIVYRDGAMYFAVMFCAQCANVISFHALPAALKGAPSTLAISISVAMMSRCILNLHTPDVQLLGATDENEEFESCLAPMTCVTGYSDEELRVGSSGSVD